MDAQFEKHLSEYAAEVSDIRATLTIDAALADVRASVQRCREEGETDLRTILHIIAYKRKEMKAAAERLDFLLAHPAND